MKIRHFLLAGILAATTFSFGCSDKVPAQKQTKYQKNIGDTQNKSNKQQRHRPKNSRSAGGSARDVARGERRREPARTESRQERHAGLKIGEPAPLFSAKTYDGKTVNLKDYRGKVVLLDFWATWCRPCVHEMPTMKKIWTEFGKSPKFGMIGISLDRDGKAVEKFVRDKGITYPHVFDGKAWKNETAKLYGVRSIPFTVIIDAKGNVVKIGLRGKRLLEEIRRLLK